MYSFEFKYFDGSNHIIDNVTSIVVSYDNCQKEYTGEAILKAHIPLDTMWLYSDNRNVTVSGQNLMVVDIHKQDN